eukprot:182587_1
MPKYAFLVLIYLAMSANLTAAEDIKLITIDALNKSKSGDEQLWFSFSKEVRNSLTSRTYDWGISSRLSPRNIHDGRSFASIHVDSDGFSFYDPRQKTFQCVTTHLHKDAQWITVYERPRNA